jgi:N-acetylglucosamine-6-phosphate deacetylase
VNTTEKPGDNWLGSGAWPDGSSFVVTARKTAGPRKEDEPATQPAAGGATAAANERNAPPSELSGGTTQVSVPDEEPPRVSDRGEGRRGPTSKPVIKEALFKVNYPLGEYGREKLPEQPTVIHFINATVWTCGPQGVLENAHVTVKNGKIESVQTGVWPPGSYDKGTVIIDCKGRHITPGVIDCHSHIATDGGINESGQAVTAEVRIGDFIDPGDINIYRQLGGGVTSSNILHGSANPIGGQNQVIKLRWGALPEEMKFTNAPPGVKFALGENVKQSNWDIPADRRSRYPQTRMGVEQIYRDEFRAAQDYKRKWDEWNGSHKGIPPRRDLELDAVVEILDGKRWIHCHSYRQDEILMLMRVCDDFGVRIGTFQHILEGYKVADEMARHAVMGSTFSDWWAYKFEVYDAIPYNGALMRQAGVVVSYNSDDAELARRLNLEAAKAVKYGGVPPEEALKFVTLNPAKQLRIDKWVGSIEPGKDADLAIWSTSPLSNYTRCEQTWIDGRKFFDREEDAKMREQNQRMRVALVQRVLQSGEAPAGEDENQDRQHVLWPNEDTFCEHGGND